MGTCHRCRTEEKGPGLSLLSSPTFQEPLPSHRCVPCPRHVPGPLRVFWSLSRAPTSELLASLRPSPTGCSLVRPGGFQLPKQGLQSWSPSRCGSDFRHDDTGNHLAPSSRFLRLVAMPPPDARRTSSSFNCKTPCITECALGHQCPSPGHSDLCPASSGMDASHRSTPRIPASLSQTRF